MDTNSQTTPGRSFVIDTLLLNTSVFLVSSIGIILGGLFVTEYLTTVGLIVQLVLIYRRETDIHWRWRWRSCYAFGLAGVTYLFISSAYAPTPLPFEAVGLLQTERVILQHYCVFLFCLLPVLISCSFGSANNRRSMARVRIL